MKYIDPLWGSHKRQYIVDYILVSMGFEISPGSHIYRDWRYINGNSVERDGTQYTQNASGGRKHINYILILHR